MNQPVQWQWACKEFDKEKAEIKNGSGMYYVISENAKSSVLGFRYVLEEKTLPLPNGVFFVKNPDIIARLDKWLETR